MPAPPTLQDALVRIAQLECQISTTNSELARTARLLGSIVNYCDSNSIKLPLEKLNAEATANSAPPPVPPSLPEPPSPNDGFTVVQRGRKRDRVSSPSPFKREAPTRLAPKRKTALSPPLIAQNPESSSTDKDSNPPGDSYLPSSSDADSANDMDASSESDKSDDEDSDEADSKVRSLPPILIRDKTLWPELKSFLSENGIEPRRARCTSDAILLYLETVADFRTLTAKLDKDTVEYSTNQLPDDRQRMVVIRGVLESLTEKEILDELQIKVPAVNRVHRMGKGNKIWPLVTVYLDRRSATVNSIFDIRSISGLAVKVEAKLQKHDIPQCRCLRFFHTANYCRAAWVCAFCASSHATAACPVKTQPEAKPKCFHCGDSHRATYRGCKKAPIKKDGKKRGKSKLASSSPSSSASLATNPQPNNSTSSPKNLPTPRPVPQPRRSHAARAGSLPVQPREPVCTSSSPSPTTTSFDPLQDPAMLQLFRDFITAITFHFRQPPLKQKGPRNNPSS